MSISKLYESETQKNNIAYFAAIANIATVDGRINEKEFNLLSKFASKLDISEEQLKNLIANPKGYSITPPNSKSERLEYLFDLFKMVFADHDIDDEEIKLVRRYAMELGYTSDIAKSIVENSIKIFRGDVSFEDYQYLVNKKPN
ncbi:TerB family tellurite resistance protein [Flavivirga amylovorans]|uniref:TerB family tellurite resistance protein n=1 Tax=Flavivirga amylovorans TaxID=870486 RepID=A0ABT8X7U0_9FLAO|nr:TerB family tellurite resistance protein [Flavivirga amylovorans]MDO5989752.1 TerB family tellurite resistance protein [Flavivirga amylovorans]